MLAALLLMSSCADKVEIEDRGFALAIGVDYEGGKITVTVCMPANSEDEVQTTAEGKGASVKEALDFIDKNTSKKLYIEHVKAVVFGQKLLEDERRVKTVLHEVNNIGLSRKTIILSCEGSAKDTVSQTPDGTNFGLYAAKYFKNGDETPSTLETVKNREDMYNFPKGGDN
ncbi:hypothetical protein FACS189490_01750 [Clostridia bacterium]|nr:hypothetical protein FACS189490_01750 [Clostridia bacterium]